MNEGYWEGVYRRNIFVARRKKIMDEWIKIHPEGITANNLGELKAFMKRREREIKKGEEPTSAGGEDEKGS